MALDKRYEITVVPRAAYLPEQSDPSKGQYVFAYTIAITNTGARARSAPSAAMLNAYERRRSAVGPMGSTVRTSISAIRFAAPVDSIATDSGIMAATRMTVVQLIAL